MNERELLVEIYSDVVCPWCYVGKRRLERALREWNGSVPVKIQWRPFQLNPAMPKEGMDRTAYLAAKFGSLDVFKEMELSLLETGGTEQISFVFQKIAKTPNTFLAHRLIWYAGLQDCQDAVVESLFKGYFEEGLDIGSSSTLIELADRADFKADQLFAGDKGIAEVKAEESVGHKLGIRGVPYFILDGTYGISGAQPADVFVASLEKARSTPRSSDGPE